MSTLAHTQGGLRPAFAHDPAFHPGLQVHAIAEPRRDRRLSLLISFLCYESLAAVALLTLQHREAIVHQLKTRTVDAILDPAAARIAPPAPLARPPVAVKAPDLPASNPPSSTVAEPNLDTLPPALPQVNNGATLVGQYDPNGVHGGKPTGGDPTGSSTRGTGGTASVLEISMTQVQVLHQAVPAYPSLARLIKVQGDVIVRMTIDTHGVPTDVKIVSGPEVLRAEALRCAQQWRFTPARSGGEAVPAAFNLTLRFMLR